ncbi:hypothetical protein [Paraburkholderia sediminicola]|uniref:hypothetical protein n=1 Tax=Paraburkholderia sediminicola TaxID=458836 RepID=UPI0038BDC0EB
MGSIMVRPNTPVGTVLATKQLTSDSVIGQMSFTCGQSVTSTISLAMSESGASGLYPTNIPGIGIRIYDWSSQGYYNSPKTPTLAPNSWTFFYSSSGAYGFGYQRFQFDLVVTGPLDISATNALSYNVAPWISVAANDGSGQMVIANLALTATVTTPTGTVSTPSVSVTLPTVAVGSLNSGSAGATSFRLGLNCTKGTNVNVTLTDASDISNTSTTLSLSPDEERRRQQTMLELLVDTAEQYQQEPECDRQLYQVIALDAKGVAQSRITASRAARLLEEASKAAEKASPTANAAEGKDASTESATSEDEDAQEEGVVRH